MRLRVLINLVAAIVMAVAASSVLAATPLPRAVDDKADPVSGEWVVLFTVEGMQVTGKLNLKLDGDKVTGTAETKHTGPGTLSKGTWANSQVNFTLNFAEHESILVTGKLKDGKLVGEFTTEGMQGTWEATRK
jgi:hypothetical protein